MELYDKKFLIYGNCMIRSFGHPGICYHKLVVPTFDTKVTEYLCSGWVFFLQTNFDFLTSHF